MFLDLRIKEKEVINRLYSSLENRGYRARILPVEKIKSLHDYSWRNYLSGKIPPRVNRLLELVFPVKPSRVFDGARSVLLVSAGQGHNLVEFDWVRRSKRLLLPPALQTYRRTEKDIKETLLNMFGSSGYSFVRAVLPLKILSSICSFLRYGSNRVAYSSNKKGTVSLFAFYTDFPSERGAANIYEVLEELCSVRPEEVRFSSRGSKFSVNETRLLLESTPLNKFPESTLQKIVSTDLVYNYDRLPKYLWRVLKVKPADFWKIENPI